MVYLRWWSMTAIKLPFERRWYLTQYTLRLKTKVREDASLSWVGTRFRCGINYSAMDSGSSKSWLDSRETRGGRELEAVFLFPLYATLFLFPSFLFPSLTLYSVFLSPAQFVSFRKSFFLSCLYWNIIDRLSAFDILPPLTSVSSPLCFWPLPRLQHKF